MGVVVVASRSDPVRRVRWRTDHLRSEPMCSLVPRTGRPAAAVRARHARASWCADTAAYPAQRGGAGRVPRSSVGGGAAADDEAATRRLSAGRPLLRLVLP